MGVQSRGWEIILSTVRYRYLNCDVRAVQFYFHGEMRFILSQVSYVDVATLYARPWSSSLRVLNPFFFFFCVRFLCCAVLCTLFTHACINFFHLIIAEILNSVALNLTVPSGTVFIDTCTFRWANDIMHSRFTALDRTYRWTGTQKERGRAKRDTWTPIWSRSTFPNLPRTASSSSAGLPAWWT